MAVDGRREFVLSGDATRAAENLIGNQLTQDNVMNSIRNSQVQYNDHRRFNNGISATERRQIRQDTVDTLSEILE
jgi:hypothetical protein